MTRKKQAERVEELRKYILSTGMTKEGIARTMALVIFRAEGLVTKEEESFQFMYNLSSSPEAIINAMAEVCQEIGECEVHDTDRPLN